MDTPPVVGHCIFCGLSLTFLPHFRGPVSIEWTPDHVGYKQSCAKSDHGHLIQLLPGTGMEEARRATASVALAEATEAAQRARNRAIAEAHEREMAEHRGHEAVTGQWHEGTCGGCGLADLPVIGLPGSEYCRNCEDLRVMGSPLIAMHEPVPPAVPEPALTRPLMLLLSFWLAIGSCVLVFLDAPQLLCLGLFAAAVIMAKLA